MSWNDYKSDLRRDALSPVLGEDDFEPLSSVVKVEFGARSHAGAFRPTNEDHFLIMSTARSQNVLETSLARGDLPAPFEERAYAMLVADGLGESGSGGVAARVALSTLAHLAIHFGRWAVRVDSITAAQIKERAEWFYRQMDQAVVERSRSHPILSEMCTTLTAAYSAGLDLFVAHVGHSRAYLFRDGALTQLTCDHTMASQIFDAPVTVRVSGVHDLLHILTDTLGSDVNRPRIDVEQIRLQDQDIVLLCTNGLTDTLKENEIADILAVRRAPVEQSLALLDRSLQDGAEDNVTVIVAQYSIPRSMRTR